MWAYTYVVKPPQKKGDLAPVQQLVDREHGSAQREGRTWSARIVREREATRILILSDKFDHEAEIDRRLQEELRQLNATVTISAPLELPDPP